MNRRTVLCGIGSVLGTAIAGCTGYNGGNPQHCPKPGDDADIVDVDETLITSNNDWLATTTPGDEPRIVLIQSVEEAAELIELDEIDDEDDQAFIEHTDYDTSALLVAEHWITAGYKMIVHGVERLDAESAHVYLCEEDHREAGKDYPAVDTLRSRVLRLNPDAGRTPDRVTGTYMTSPPGETETALTEYAISPHSEDQDGA